MFPKKNAKLISRTRDTPNLIGKCSNLALSYEHGRGVEMNEEKAARFYKLAADQGNATAQPNLGLMYETARVVAEDDEDAARGRIVAKDDEEAARLYKLAAEQGNA